MATPVILKINYHVMSEVEKSSIVELETWRADCGDVFRYALADTIVRVFSGTLAVSFDCGESWILYGPSCATREFQVKAGESYCMQVIEGGEVVYHRSEGKVSDEAVDVARAMGRYFLFGVYDPGPKDE